jgi:hypothetical protein
MLEWCVATLIGVIIGTFLGADKVGLVQQIPGDILFGLGISLAQLPVLYRHIPKHDNRVWLWVAAGAIAFPISVILGRRSVAFFAPGADFTMLNFCFGIGMGLGHGVIQSLAIRTFLPSVGWRSLIWIPISLIGWIFAEVISLGSEYTFLLSLPVGLALGVAGAIGWWLILSPIKPSQSASTTFFRTTDQNSA